jgi:hypothetical protein
VGFKYFEEDAPSLEGAIRDVSFESHLVFDNPLVDPLVYEVDQR